MSDTEACSRIREECRRWIAGQWHPDMLLAQWRVLLADSGWACPTWPEQWCGRGLSLALGRVVADEMRRAIVPGPPEGVGMMLVAPVLLEHGSEELKERYIRPTVTGEITWCQLFSEPGAACSLVLVSVPTAGDSAARRCGRPARQRRTSGSCSPGPTGTCPSIRASPHSCCLCASQELPSGRCAR